MFRTLFRKEIVSHVLSLRFGVTFILFILLVFASMYVTANQHQRDAALYSATVRAGGDLMDEVAKEKDPGEQMARLLYWDGRLDAVPVPELSSIVQGLQPFTHIAAKTTIRDARYIGRGSEKNPLSGLLRIPDLVYVVSVVLSLLAILFAFDSVCGEKEAGTLRLMLANALPRHAVLLGKWAGGYVVLAIPFLIAAVGGLGYAWWQGALQLKAENLQRLGALLLVACLYISVFFTLSLFVSTMTHRATTALFICLLIWVVWILAIPNLAPVVAKIISPAPSLEKIKAEKEAVDKEIELRIRRLTLVSGELEYGKAVEQEREKLRQEGEHRKRRWDRFLADATRRQTQLAETLGRLSPSACWTYSAVALTDTGPAAYKRLGQAQERLMKELEAFATRLREQRNKTGKWPQLNPDDVPRLEVVAPRFGVAVSDALNDVLILAILNVVFFMAAFVLFLRYDVR